MNNTRKPDLLSYEIQAQTMRQQAIADLARSAAQALARLAGAVRGWVKPRRPVSPATLPL